MTFRFTPKKTKIVNFFFASEPCNVYCDTDVEFVESHRDLGLIVSSNLSRTEHVSVRRAKAYNTFHQVRQNCFVNIGVRAKLDPYKRTVLSVIFFASACWFANRGDIRRLEALQKNFQVGSSNSSRLQEKTSEFRFILFHFIYRCLTFTISKFCANVYDVVSAFLSIVSGALRENRNIPQVQHPRSEVMH